MYEACKNNISLFVLCFMLLASCTGCVCTMKNISTGHKVLHKSTIVFDSYNSEKDSYFFNAKINYSKEYLYLLPWFTREVTYHIEMKRPIPGWHVRQNVGTIFSLKYNTNAVVADVIDCPSTVIHDGFMVHCQDAISVHDVDFLLEQPPGSVVYNGMVVHFYRYDNINQTMTANHMDVRIMTHNYFLKKSLGEKVADSMLKAASQPFCFVIDVVTFPVVTPLFVFFGFMNFH